MTAKTEAQPEALRLAARLDCDATDADMGRKPIACTRRKAAAELRRQHAEIQQFKAEAQALAELLSDSLAPESKDWKDGGILDRVQFLLTMREASQQYCAELEAQLSVRQAAPDGWRLVPVEPDTNMKRAAQKALMDHSPHREWLEEEWPDGLRMWNGMLSAAPPPPQREPLQMIECKCGDAFDVDSYNAGFTDAAGKCPNCSAADDAAHGIGATNDK